MPTNKTIVILIGSLWYNELIEAEAALYGMTILPQPGDTTLEHLCGRVLATAAL
ncbi:MAG: hypothetical protein ACK2UP_09260 [Candidatus Promineifilaceae bacterium]